ncbi:hypothetical protein [Rufibacter quisquiliarum]|uniref:Uncharacterized protein n=1 Tax=Rufibacter quisquiliarum TaxID=1549639 RepID=A0A839GAV7_9BACT|nr:hypothetical protein [Rufibacter quisquiliarum]MBA9076062.1 hypothetical protein [Rufibacter quisquiliarum]
MDAYTRTRKEEEELPVIKEARKKLPLPSGHAEEYYRVLIPENELMPFSQARLLPSPSDHREVCVFRKSIPTTPDAEVYWEFYAIQKL